MARPIGEPSIDGALFFRFDIFGPVVALCPALPLLATATSLLYVAALSAAAMSRHKDKDSKTNPNATCVDWGRLGVPQEHPIRKIKCFLGRYSVEAIDEDWLRRNKIGMIWNLMSHEDANSNPKRLVVHSSPFGFFFTLVFFQRNRCFVILVIFTCFFL